jgi:hypothetical protein
VALAVGVVAVFATIAVGRVSYDRADEPRYVYVAMALLVAPFAGLLTAMSAPVRRLPRGALLVALLSALAVALPILYGERALRSTSAADAGRQQQVRRFVVASVKLFKEGEPVVSDQLHILENADVTIELLRALSRTNALGDQRPTDNDSHLAAALLQVVVSTDEPHTPITGHAQLRSVKGPVIRDAATGCVVFQGADPRKLLLDNEGATRLSVVTTADVSVALIDPQAGSSATITSYRYQLPGQGPEQRWWIALTWSGSVQLSITGGPATVCGIEG